VKRFTLAGLAAVALLVVGDQQSPGDDAAKVQELIEIMDKLRPLHQPLGEPEPGDWLAMHHERGQTFRQYVRSGPALPRGERRVIYIQPLGEFTERQQEVVALTAEFMGLYFGLPVKTREGIPLSVIPAKARRRNPLRGMEQVLTSHVLKRVLAPRLPEDAAAYLAFTASDLWPGRGWNFVFGQASLRDRVGVWSIYRNGDPDESEEAFRLCLLRTMKTGVHELGHMFSMAHCTAYECCMNGSNSRRESDQHPLALCPECMAKVCWATGSDPAERYRKLAAFCAEHGLEAEAEFYEASLSRIAPPAEPVPQQDTPPAQAG